MTRSMRLTDTYRFTGFTPKPSLQGIFGDPFARVITLVRRQKKRHAALAALITQAFTTKKSGASVTSPVEGETGKTFLPCR